MQQLEFHKIFVEKLEVSNIPYMVTGSVASIFYGEPRLTHDIDFVLFIHKTGIKRFMALFPESEYYYHSLPGHQRAEICRNQGERYAELY